MHCFVDIIEQLKLFLPDGRLPEDAAANISNPSSSDLLSENAGDGKSVLCKILLNGGKNYEAALLRSKSLRQKFEKLLQYACKHPEAVREVYNFLTEGLAGGKEFSKDICVDCCSPERLSLYTSFNLLIATRASPLPDNIFLFSTPPARLA
ncbi:unnamed protein product [Gongylonema pulchrum]|uniref:Uncharacterized protein n=1 Tax=Gongylonema pulchrum TaxID=637853 RepID=A0A3P7MZA6_9BILA|nr:unnamed protein product [Gongylonema pulchrum]